MIYFAFSYGSADFGPVILYDADPWVWQVYLKRGFYSKAHTESRIYISVTEWFVKKVAQFLQNIAPNMSMLGTFHPKLQQILQICARNCPKRPSISSSTPRVGSKQVWTGFKTGFLSGRESKLTHAWFNSIAFATFATVSMTSRQNVVVCPSWPFTENVLKEWYSLAL